MAKAPSKFSGGLKKKKGDGPAAGGPGRAVEARSTPSGPRRKLGQILIDLGLINEEQFAQVLEYHRQTGDLFGQSAIKLQIITPQMLMQALAEQQGMKTINLRDGDLKIAKAAKEMVSETMCSLYKVMPISLEGSVLTVAIADPTNVGALDDLRNFLSVSEVQAVVADEADILAAIEEHYAGEKDSIENIVASMESDEDEELNFSGSIDLDSLEEMADAAPVRKLVNMVLLTAVRDKASDVHFEPFQQEFKMRYRVDGVMHELVPPPRHLAPAIASRIKVMANLDIAERRLPQDGRIELNIGGNPVDLRVSVLPTMFGEGIVCRVLDRSVVNLDLENVGMPPKILEDFRQILKFPHGIVLVTGPTGSGKTTTLYSALNALNTIDVKIITTEDPIEYDIEGLVQVPVNPDFEVTFASALRAILRHDPDIILVGEIRDFETAQIAIQSSLTGHLVFSTLHTNDAASSITRLLDMGVPPFLITATVEAILAQRLVRRICTNCREEFNPSPEMLMELNLRSDQVGGRKFYHGGGCERCHNTGHKGRTGIHELLILTDEIRQLIMDGAPTDQVNAVARRNGMTTLREAGLAAIFDGTTTIDEVVRETAMD